jgi:CRISPR-associated protein Csd1
VLLQRLAEYGGDGDLPPMYQLVPIRYIIALDRDGRPRTNPLRLIDTATTEHKRGVPRLAPNRKQTSGVKPKLLADKAKYTLCLVHADDNPERVRLMHAAYVDLVAACAAQTGEPSLAAVHRFLTMLDTVELDLLEDFDPAANLTFDVDGQYPMDLPSVRAFWATEASAADPNDTPMQCLVCGEMRPAVERLAIAIKGIPGGQPTGMALISANEHAFMSYGLRASQIAPTCEECGLRFGNALNRLLSQRDTHLNVSGLSFVFWTREPAPFSLATLLADARPDEVRGFLSSAWRGTPGAARLDTTPFYAVTLSASVARVVVRDWIETTLGEAQRHLRRYFALQRLVDVSGTERWFPLWQLLRATTHSKSKTEEAAPQVGQALLHVALHGGRLPSWLLYQAVRRVRAEQEVSPARAALIKMVLVSQRPDLEGGNDMAELDRANLDPAYLCGRLLAELEAIQRAALGYDINATVVDRYYGTASSAPASVFGRLLRGVQPHLSKLRRDKPGLAWRFDERLNEITQHITSFPSTLTLNQQGLFALGYYHQRAADSREMQAAKQVREARAPAGVTANAGDD